MAWAIGASGPKGASAAPAVRNSNARIVASIDFRPHWQVTESRGRRRRRGERWCDAELASRSSFVSIRLETWQSAGLRDGNVAGSIAGTHAGGCADQMRAAGQLKLAAFGSIRLEYFEPYNGPHTSTSRGMPRMMHRTCRYLKKRVTQVMIA